MKMTHKQNRDDDTCNINKLKIKIVEIDVHSDVKGSINATIFLNHGRMKYK